MVDLSGYILVDKSDVNLIRENSSIVYIFKVDFEYPDELHYLHKDYLLAPEKLAILDDMLSNYCKKIVDKYGIKVGDVKKLIPNLGNKSCLRSSLQKSSVVFVFRNKTDLNSQSFKIYTIWLNEKIYRLNTEKRKNAANIFEKYFFKLMINCVYGKAMANLRKRI